MIENSSRLSGDSDMSSSDPRRTGSIRGKVSLLYSATFTATLLLGFIAVFLSQRYATNKSAMKKLDTFSREFTYEYMVGSELKHVDLVLTISDVDPSVTAVILERNAMFKPEEVFIDTQGFLNILGAADGEVLTFTMPKDDPRGLVVKSHEVEDRGAVLDHQFNEESYGEDVNHVYFMLISPDGKMLAKSGFTEIDGSFFTQHELPAPGEVHTYRLPYGDGRILAKYRGLYDGNVIMTAEHMRHFDRALKNLLYALLATFILSLPVSYYSGRYIARRVVNGLDRVIAAARIIGAGNYSERVAHGTEGKEINYLADAFNAMTANTEKLLSELKMISNDMAHDLRTPITRLRGQAEMALYSSNGSNELACDVAEECGNMLTMINTMLEIARAEYRLKESADEELDMAQIARDSVSMFETISEDKNVDIIIDVPDTPVVLRIDKVDVQRIFANLLDNAVKFTPFGGRVAVALAEDEAAVTIRVSDTGPGIPQKDRKRVFERFYRSDVSRHVPGNGLGLSLVKAIVDARNGTIAVLDKEGGGTVFTVTLPRMQARS